MIHRLELRNLFTHRNRDIVFSPGLTAISGPNESGKSLILEAIRFALFGARALRSTVDGYAGASVSLTFSVREYTYRIERTVKSASVCRIPDEEVLAAGTKTVNSWVVNLLGYGLDVFDTGNAINQGQIEALCNMPAAERKRMIDRTLGLDLIERLAGEMQAREKSFRSQVSILNQRLVEPEPPVRPEIVPDPPRDLDSLDAEIQSLEEHQRQRTLLEGWLSRPAPKPPEPLPEKPAGESLEAVEAVIKRREALTHRSKSLESNINDIPTPKTTPEQLEAIVAEAAAIQERLEAVRFLESCTPAPTFTPEVLDELETRHQRLAAWEARERLLKRGHHECPACHHRWPIASAEIEALGCDLTDERPEAPTLTKSEIATHRKQIASYNAETSLREKYTAVLAKYSDRGLHLSWKQEEIEAERKAHALAPTREKMQRDLEEVMGELATLPDMSAEARAWKIYMVKLAAHEAAHEHYVREMEERVRNEIKYKDLPDCAEHLAHLKTERYETMTYLAAMRTYLKQLEHYLEGCKERDQLLEEAVDHERARAALNELKLAVKAYVVPSLSAVGSQLLSVITGGNRSSLHVDEGLDVLVDGLPITALSGSTKAAANLALRVGIGQVLTNRVFSVLLGDELDAAMDGSRAAHTADCLRQLSHKIGQIILVSHKDLDADHHVRL